MSLAWKCALVYHLTFIFDRRYAPLVERLSYLVGNQAFADAEYQAVMRDLACA
jgi:hypothetical protein